VRDVAVTLFLNALNVLMAIILTEQHVNNAIVNVENAQANQQIANLVNLHIF